jgi:hypothetical protein
MSTSLVKILSQSLDATLSDLQESSQPPGQMLDVVISANIKAAVSIEEEVKKPTESRVSDFKVFDFNTPLAKGKSIATV